jgi:acyl-coenzyme A thioesterase PaaI-like protein
MNQQWLTILMSKGIELEQSLRGRFQATKESLKTQMEERGLRMSPADLAALIEEISPKASHAALSYAMDVLRPFSAGMGLRISRLSDTRIEMILPFRTRNSTEDKALHEGALITASIEAAKTLWTRHAPVGHFAIEVRRCQSEFFRTEQADCRLRLEVSETLRETILAELRHRGEAMVDASILVFEENEQAVAEINLSLKLSHSPAIGRS